MNDAGRIKEILERAKTIAIVGISKKEDRDSFRVARYLKEKGYKIIPVNPQYAGEMILGEKVRSSLEEVEEQIDILDVFRKPSAVFDIAKMAVQKKIPVVWLQLGVVNEEAKNYMEKNGIEVIMDRCIKIEHQKLFRS